MKIVRPIVLHTGIWNHIALIPVEDKPLGEEKPINKESLIGIKINKAK